MNFKDTVIKGAGWAFAERWGRHLISAGVFFLLARILSPRDFGLLAIAGIYITLLNMTLEEGLIPPVIQHRALKDEHLHSAFWTSMCTGCLLMAASMLLAAPIAAIFRQPEAAPLIRWLSVSFPLRSISSVQRALFARELNFRVLAIRSLVSISAGGAVGIGMALSGCGVWSLVGQQLSMRFTDTAVICAYSRWHPRFRISMDKVRELLSFGVYTAGHSLLHFFSGQTDKMLIGYFLGARALGYYFIAYKVLTMGMNLTARSTQQVAFSLFSRVQKDRQQLRRTFYKVIRVVSIFAFPVLAGIAVLAPEMIGTLLGERWDPSIPAVRPLMLAGALQSILFYHDAALKAAGRPDLQFRLKAVSTVLCMCVLLLVVRRGISAVAGGYAAALYVTYPLQLLVLKRVLDIRITDYFRQLAVPVGGCTVMACVLWGMKTAVLTPESGALALGMVILAGAAAYAAALRIISPVSFREILHIAKTTVKGAK